MTVARVALFFFRWHRPQGGEWCGREGVNRNGINSTTADSADGDATRDGNDDVDGCCFTVSVSDARNANVNDETGPLCIDAAAFLSAEGVSTEDADIAARGDGGSGGSSSSGGEAVKAGDATLEIVKFPSGPWEIGTVQEVRTVLFLFLYGVGWSRKATKALRGAIRCRVISYNCFTILQQCASFVA